LTDSVRSLVGSSVVLGQDCKPVAVGQVEINYILTGPEDCGEGWDVCASSVVRGTINGTFTEFLSMDDEV
jgi:hypothetical protein